MPRSATVWMIPYILTLVALLLPDHARAQSCPATNADKTAVIDTLRTFYAAASVDDIPRMHTVTAPDFYAFDGGQSFASLDSLMKNIQTYRDKGFKFVWSVTDPHVTVHCGDAWIRYVNIGSVQMPNQAPEPYKWLESAVLEKQSGRWKIVFFQSTPVPPTASAK